MATGDSKEKTKDVNGDLLEDRSAKLHKDDAKGERAATRLSDERYRAFIESINDGVYEVDIHGNFIYFNDAAPTTTASTSTFRSTA